VLLLLKKRVEMREIRRMCVVFLPLANEKKISIFCVAATWKKKEKKREKGREKREILFYEKSLQFYYSH